MLGSRRFGIAKRLRQISTSVGCILVRDFAGLGDWGYLNRHLSFGTAKPTGVCNDSA